MFNIYIKKLRCVLFSNLSNILQQKSVSIESCKTISVCIVGSGPAGFYTCQKILKNNPEVKIDIFEKECVPFGLIRFGVSPLHPDVKICSQGFQKMLHNPRVKFFGNIEIGKDILISDLKESYNSIIFSYGCYDIKQLNIDGNTLSNVVTSFEFVNWYNGHPNYKNLAIDLSIENVIIIGMGNVALDIAKILLYPVALLEKTDVTDYALQVLKSSQVRKVYIIGRRGPVEAAFTIKELRSLAKIPNCNSYIPFDELKLIETLIPTLDRSKKRMIELMFSIAGKKLIPEQKCWELKFKRTPLKLIPSDDGKSVSAIKLGVTKLVRHGESFIPVLEENEETIPCGLVISSIGYRGLPIESFLPFDVKRGIIKNNNNMVEGLPGFFCSGWISRGPNGVILHTMEDGFNAGNAVAQYLKQESSKSGSVLIESLLRKKGLIWCDVNTWDRIDQEEKSRGVIKGKPREKIVDRLEMLNYVNNA